MASRGVGGGEQIWVTVQWRGVGGIPRRGLPTIRGVSRGGGAGTLQAPPGPSRPLQAPPHLHLGHSRLHPGSLAHLTLPLCRAEGAAAAAAAAAEDEDEEALPEEEENRPILPYSSFFILSSTNP